MTDVLSSGSTLTSSDPALVSANGTYSLKMQSNGALMLKNVVTNKALWFRPTSPSSGAVCTMQSNGYLVVHDTTVYWSAPTSPVSGSCLIVENSGHAVIRDSYPSGTIIWTSDNTMTAIAPRAASEASDNFQQLARHVHKAHTLAKSMGLAVVDEPPPGSNGHRYADAPPTSG